MKVRWLRQAQPTNRPSPSLSPVGRGMDVCAQTFDPRGIAPHTCSKERCGAGLTSPRWGEERRTYEA